MNQMETSFANFQFQNGRKDNNMAIAAQYTSNIAEGKNMFRLKLNFSIARIRILTFLNIMQQTRTIKIHRSDANSRVENIDSIFSPYLKRQ